MRSSPSSASESIGSKNVVSVLGIASVTKGTVSSRFFWNLSEAQRDLF